MPEYVIAEEADFQDSERIIVELEGREIAVFNLEGDYYAYANWCPHQGGPLCEGVVSGTTKQTFDRDDLTSTMEWVKDDQIMVCPWHGWEFDITSGLSCHQPTMQIPSYPVHTDDGNVVVTL